MRGAAALLAAACAGPSAPPVVVLASFDTTRADALGCYEDVSGWGLDLPVRERPPPSTPVVDDLARKGARFRWALAQAPTTLSSHATVMSALDPHAHRSARNGHPIPEGVPLLAERFAAAGWDTLAAVGASPLERAMGLDRGFRLYDDAVSDPVRRRFEDPAPRVTARALALVARRLPDRPLFLFVHYFDAHSPWQPADPGVDGYSGDFDGSEGTLDVLIKRTRAGEATTADRRQARAKYLAEVSRADGALGDLLAALEGDRLVVVMGDHGETLDEIPARPYGHGLDVDLGSIHVPLVVAGTGRLEGPPGVVIDRQARLQDLAPTLLGLVGLPSDLGDGQDLSALVRGGASAGEPQVAFAEATKPAAAALPGEWQNLRFDRAAARGGFLLTRTPYLREGPALFRLEPGQPVAEDPAAMDALTRALLEWDAGAPGERKVEVSEETAEGLRVLGYVE